MSEEFIHYDFDINQFDLFQLTVRRDMLNEIMNILSSKNHVDVTVDKEGHIGFDIPNDSPINIRSFNIIKELI